MQFLQKRVAGAIKASVALLRFFLPINAGSVIIRNSEHETCSTDLCIAKHATGYSTDSNTARERREQVWIARQQREW